jgi:hypothetical protein
MYIALKGRHELFQVKVFKLATQQTTSDSCR